MSADPGSKQGGQEMDEETKIRDVVIRVLKDYRLVPRGEATGKTDKFPEGFTPSNTPIGFTTVEWIAENLGYKAELGLLHHEIISQNWVKDYVWEDPQTLQRYLRDDFIPFLKERLQNKQTVGPSSSDRLYASGSGKLSAALLKSDFASVSRTSPANSVIRLSSKKKRAATVASTT